MQIHNSYFFVRMICSFFPATSSAFFNSNNSRFYQRKTTLHFMGKLFLILMLSNVLLLTKSYVYAYDVSVKPISDRLKFKASETRWISLGAGYRGTGLWTENGNGNLDGGHYSNDNARIYLNGQINQYLKFEVNTDVL